MTKQEMKQAVIRAAQRELELKICGPIDDPQIVGPAYDVSVEGEYLGWTSKSFVDELEKLYKKTPSLLRYTPRANMSADEALQAQSEIAQKACRQLEADMMVEGDVRRVSEVQRVRGLVDRLSTMILEKRG